ncbi:unnamed protein product [Mycena citricolor]|uniref:Fatty acid desaturase domain-containing protein n=1 Tax=Mycena citricolor TaxID=2018698 RepID=A0AAD2H015_9AGAR|nr:unnamed protein product [Mycena citricolor]
MFYSTSERRRRFRSFESACSSPSRGIDAHTARSTLKEIREHIPSHLFYRKTTLALCYLLRDCAVSGVLILGAARIDTHLRPTLISAGLPSGAAYAVVWLSWMIYWWFQGLTFTGLWVIGHECGHGAFSASRRLSDCIGFIIHTGLLTPYFSWKFVHRRHHAHHGSIENDEVYVPQTRMQHTSPKHSLWDNLEEKFGDTPIYTLFALVTQQLLGFPAYLLYNVSGQKRYPRWSNHFNPNATMFTASQAWGVVLSDLGLVLAFYLLRLACLHFGVSTVVKIYGIPWLLVTHWFIMITYLHHTDPILPHYRSGNWTFARGAAATIDRDFLGWQGRFFFHDVAHFHVIHHFFPTIPWYNAEEATCYLRQAIGPHYHRSSSSVFKALWISYQFCQFVEDTGAHKESRQFTQADDAGVFSTGQTVFYRNRQGVSAWDVPELKLRLISESESKAKD